LTILFLLLQHQDIVAFHTLNLNDSIKNPRDLEVVA